MKLFHKPYSSDLITGIFSVKRKGQLVRVLIKLSQVVGVKLSAGFVRTILSFSQRLLHIRTHQGLTGLVKYLKVCSVCVQQSVAGHYQKDITSLGPRVSRTSRGKPRILPKEWRSDDNPLLLKFCLTALNLYRDIVIDAPIKLKSITDPFHGSWYWIQYVSGYTDLFTQLFIGKQVSPEELTPIQPRVILKSAPGVVSKDEYSTHPRVVKRNFRSLLNNFQVFLPLMKMVRYLPNRLTLVFQYLFANANKDFQDPEYDSTFPLGKLGLKHEPAGKMRVFAMVDPITQWILEPIHKYIFKILKGKEMDGTFDQTKPLMRIKWLTVPLFSLDLSSATDRLPLILQRNLLNSIIKVEIEGEDQLDLSSIFQEPVKRHWTIGDLWSIVLTGREYQLKDKLYKYSVGQPMGALSSWAMLALTHHLIVQVAAWRTGWPKDSLFKEYAVLGDDIVIWNRLVAECYLKIINGLGVECGLAKSVLSPMGLGLEFAKRTLFKGQDISPVPFKEFASATQTLSAFNEFRKKYNLSDTTCKTLIGLGFRSKTNPYNRVSRLLTLMDDIPDTPTKMIDLITFEGISLLEKSSFRRDLPLKSLPQLIYVRDKSMLLMLRHMRSEMNLLLKRIPSPYDLAAQAAAIDDMVLWEIIEDQTKDTIRTLDRLRRLLRFNIRSIDDVIRHIEWFRPFFDLPPFTGRYSQIVGPNVPVIKSVLNSFFLVMEEFSSLTSTMDLSARRRLLDKEVEDSFRVQRLWRDYLRLLKLKE